MTEQTNLEPAMPIDPTGMQKTEQYTDISMTGLFNAHVTTINSERQVIWMRYNTMLFANSVIVNVLGRKDVDRFTLWGLSIVGIGLCCFWMLMLNHGWELFRRWNRNALRFSWQNLEPERNPYVISEAWRTKVTKDGATKETKGGWIYDGAVYTIWLFILGYIFLFIKGVFVFDIIK